MLWNISSLEFQFRLLEYNDDDDTKGIVHIFLSVDSILLTLLTVNEDSIVVSTNYLYYLPLASIFKVQQILVLGFFC